MRPVAGIAVLTVGLGLVLLSVLCWPLWPPAVMGAVLVLSVLLFVAGFGAHEVMHLLLIYAVGSNGVILARNYSANNYFLPFSSFSPFGFNGRYLYGRVSINF